MGIRGLKSFVENQNIQKPHRLHDCVLVIDANNLVSIAFAKSDKGRSDLFGGDFVRFKRFLIKFFRNLAECNVRPILFFDGAQETGSASSKTQAKLRRARERLNKIFRINKLGMGDFVMPSMTAMVLKSIAIDLGVDTVQSMYEADADLASYAKNEQALLLSNDSDFLLYDLPNGVIPIDSLLDSNRVLCSHYDDDHIPGNEYLYMTCNIYYRRWLLSRFPGLEPEVLPLFGIMAGNDFVDPKVFAVVCSLISWPDDYRGQRRGLSKSNERIYKLFFFMRGKTTNQLKEQILRMMEHKHRAHRRVLIDDQLAVGNYKTHVKPEEGQLTAILQSIAISQLQPISRYECEIIEDHLMYAFDQRLLTYRILDLMHRNTVFLNSSIDDRLLSSAHMVRWRPMSVMLTLTRMCSENEDTCWVYDRVGDSYEGILIQALQELSESCSIRYSMYDLVCLDPDEKLPITLATFYSHIDEFEDYRLRYSEYMSPTNAGEFSVIVMLLKYIMIESDARPWLDFKLGYVTCVMYYYVIELNDMELIQPHSLGRAKGMLKNIFGNYELTPQLSNAHLYNFRLTHFISQMMTAITSYNELNSLLEEGLPRVRVENWLNSCLIYNVTEMYKSHRWKSRIHGHLIDFDMFIGVIQEVLDDLAPSVVY